MSGSAEDPSALPMGELLQQLAHAPAIEPEDALYPLHEGDVVAGAFRVEKRIGRGGMGVVYLAQDIALGRPVALKLRRHRTSRPSVDRLLREARVMARLQHPHVVTILEVGEHAESQVFIAMEYVEGGSLADWLAKGPHPWREVVERFVQAARGLAAAHAAGIVHRDFKPENALVHEDGRVRVADFGLASLNADVVAPAKEGRSGLAGTGVVGTPPYMSPEHADGRALTPAADQFSFCVALYEALYRTLPFDGDGKLHGPPAATTVPRWVHRVVARGLASAPDDRYPSMDALIAALETDPWRRPLRLLGLTALLGAVGSVTWVMAQPAEAPCDAASELAPQWSAAARDAFREAFLASPVAYASTTTTEVVAALDAHAEAWIEERDAVCRAEFASPSALLAAKRRCLDRNRARLAGVLEQLGAGGDAAVEHAVDVVAKLPSPQECDRVGTLAAAPAPTPEVAAQIDAVETALSRATTAITLSQIDDAKAALASAEARAAELGRLDVDARVASVRGDLRAQSEDEEAAVEAYSHALKLALQVDDTTTAGDAATMIAMKLSMLRSPEEAQRMLAIAEGLATRADAPTRLRARLHTARLAVALHGGRYEDALASGEAAVALAEQERGPDHPMLATSLTNLAIPLGAVGRTDEAIATVDRAIEIVARTKGADHPSMGYLLAEKAAHLTQLERHDEALEAGREALRLQTVAYGATSGAAVRTAVNLTSILLPMGKIDDALAILEPIAARFEAEGRTQDTLSYMLWDNLGAALVKGGDAERGLVLISRAIEILERDIGKDAAELVAPLSKQALAFEDLGRLDEAVAALARALSIQTRVGPATPRVPRLRSEYARVLTSHGKEAEARRQLELAREEALAAGLPELAERIRAGQPGE